MPPSPPPSEPEPEYKELLNADASNQAELIRELADDKVNDLTNDGRVADLIASTNASGWTVDTLEIIPDSIEASPVQVTCDAHVQFAGDQDEDSGPLGTIISGTLSITIRPDLSVQITDLDVDIDTSDWDE